MLPFDTMVATNAAPGLQGLRSNCHGHTPSRNKHAQNRRAMRHPTATLTDKERSTKCMVTWLSFNTRSMHLNST